MASGYYWFLQLLKVFFNSLNLLLETLVINKLGSTRHKTTNSN